MSLAGLSIDEIAHLAGVPQDAARDREKPSAQTSDVIYRVGSPGNADATTMVFATDSRTLAQALASAAGVILAPLASAERGQRPAENASLPDDRDARVLRVRDPKLAFARCAKQLGALQTPEGQNIHASAVVDPTAVMGMGVRIGPGAVVEAGARLGDAVSIGPRAVIGQGVVLGDRVVVQAGAVLGSQGFGYVRDAASGEYVLFPQQGALVVEDDVEIGANTTIDRGALEETRIGRGTKIDNLVHIGHNCRIGCDVVIAAQVGISGSCTIEDGAVLAGQVGISDHCHVGPGVILGGQAGVYRGKAVTGPGELFAGTPAEPWRDQMRSLATLRSLAKRGKR